MRDILHWISKHASDLSLCHLSCGTENLDQTETEAHLNCTWRVSRWCDLDLLQIKKKKNAKSAIDPGIESFNAINELCLNLNFIITQSRQYLQKMKPFGTVSELDPVGSTVRYEMMKLCTGSVKHRQTLKNRATQLFRSGSGALVTQFLHRKLRPKRAHMLQSW